MKITPIQVTIADLTKNYKDDCDGGVFGYDDRLTIRPSYQREFIYKDKQRDLVIDSVMKGRPLNIMYWPRAYERQEHKCAICGKVFDLAEMDGDHIVPWSQGGRTVDENLQMLCKKCNNEKSDK